MSCQTYDQSEDLTNEEIRQGNVNLLLLADYVEQYQQTAESKGYDQRRISHDCGAPACLFGHAMFKWPSLIIDGEHALFGISNTEAGKLFSTGGCDNAGTDWRKAVDFVRKFVADREAVINQSVPK